MYAEGKYQVVQAWSGKVKTINSKDFVETFGTGRYFPPEGATLFQGTGSDVKWFIGGAKNAKPGHWNASNNLIQVKLKPVDKDYSLEGFKLFNHSVSRTSEFPSMAFAPGITVESSEERLLGFTVNGKNLSCPGRELFLSNEIRIVETASPTTFRNRIIRVPARAETIQPGFTSEILQSGDIPPPMYGNSLTSLSNNGLSGRAVLVGGAFLRNSEKSITQLMFEHVLSCQEMTWAEESSGGVWTLDWCMDPLKFHWTRVLEIEPRTFHSSVLLGNSLLVFGGTNILTGERLQLLPVNINTSTWELHPLQSVEFPGEVVTTAHSMIKISPNSCIGIGGYQKSSSQPEETAVDSMFECQFHLSEEGIVDQLVSFLSRALNSGPVAHNFILDTPSNNCLMVAGGTIERWAVLSTNTLPGDPCDLVTLAKCKVILRSEPVEETVFWI